MITRYEIITCECGKKYLTEEGIDNTYNCKECSKKLTGTKPMVYLIEEGDLAKLIEKNFKGELGKAYNEE